MRVLPGFSILFSCIMLMAGCPLRGQGIVLPEIPDSLVVPSERAEYLAFHYWDNFDFGDAALPDAPADALEQAFVDFLAVLQLIPGTYGPLDTLFCRAATHPDMLGRFVSLGEKYLSERYSPMRDESLYIGMLRVLSGLPELSAGERGKASFRLEMALKNRPGSIASDFGFMLRDGTGGRLGDVNAEYVVVFFYDPSCGDCLDAISALGSSAVLSGMLERGEAAVLSVCVAGDTQSWRDSAAVPPKWIDACDAAQSILYGNLYELRSLPVLYLLGEDGRVLLKDALPGEIIGFLSSDLESQAASR